MALHTFAPVCNRPTRRPGTNSHAPHRGGFLLDGGTLGQIFTITLQLIRTSKRRSPFRRAAPRTPISSDRGLRVCVPQERISCSLRHHALNHQNRRWCRRRMLLASRCRPIFTLRASQTFEISFASSPTHVREELVLVGATGHIRVMATSDGARQAGFTVELAASEQQTMVFKSNGVEKVSAPRR